jgi:5-(carboxyamino)imidazole ribonucleotide synthase
METKGYKRPVLGVVGGGQLGRMLIQAAVDLDVEVHILDPDENAPCKHLCASFAHGDFRDYNTVLNFGKGKHTLTIEFEDINADALQELETTWGVKVYPQPRVIKLVQDKGEQKMFYAANGIPTSSYHLVANREEAQAYADKGPFFQKLRRGGYDGKGVKKLGSIADFETAYNEPSALEALVNFEKELSVIVARNPQGEVKAFPAVEMYFNPIANLVEFLFAPANISPEVEQEAERIAIEVATKLEIVGVLAVEMFLTKEGEVLVNEIAPRPHNSGHQSIEGNITSQYEQHLRAILGLPLGDTSIIKPASMLNLLGEPGNEGEAVYQGMEELLKIEGVYPHLYGKKFTKPYRKMGHITILADTVDELLAKTEKVKGMVKVVA